MALGHPLGGTGTKLMATLLHELRRQKAIGIASRKALKSIEKLEFASEVKRNRHF